MVQTTKGGWTARFGPIDTCQAIQLVLAGVILVWIGIVVRFSVQGMHVYNANQMV